MRMISKRADTFTSTCSAFLSPSRRVRATSAGMPAIITLSPCSTRRDSTERQYAGDNAKHFRPENDINQITWQVQSVSEMAEASRYFRELEVEIMREGRAGGEARNFISTSGRRTSRSSNSTTASNRSTGTATPARSRCATAPLIRPTSRSYPTTSW